MKRFLSLSISVLMVLSLFVVPAGAEGTVISIAHDATADTSPDAYVSDSSGTSGSNMGASTSCYREYTVNITEPGVYSLAAATITFATQKTPAVSVIVDNNLTGTYKLGVNTAQSNGWEYLGEVPLAAGERKIKLKLATASNFYLPTLELTKVRDGAYSFAYKRAAKADDANQTLDATVANNAVAHYLINSNYGNNIGTSSWVQYKLPEGIAAGCWRVTLHGGGSNAANKPTAYVRTYLSATQATGGDASADLGTWAGTAPVAAGDYLTSPYEPYHMGIIKLDGTKPYLAFKMESGDIGFNGFTLEPVVLDSSDVYRRKATFADNMAEGVTGGDPWQGMSSGHWAEYTIQVAEAGDYHLRATGVANTSPAPLTASIGGETVGSAVITGLGWLNPTTADRDYDMGVVTLPAGEATIRFQTGNTLRFFDFSLTPVKAGDTQVYTRAANTRSAHLRDTDYYPSGSMTGSPVTLYQNGWVGYQVEAAEAGTYVIDVYSKVDTGEASLELCVNGESQGTLALPLIVTAAWGKLSWTVDLLEGENTLTLKAVSGTGAKLDSFAVQASLQTAITDADAAAVTTLTGLTDETLTITGPADKTDCTMVAALYADGALVKAAIGAVDGTVLTATLSGVTTDATKDNELRVYYWNSLADMQPVAGYYTVK